MSHPARSSLPRLIAIGATLLLLAGLAQAQYVWIDAKGLRQYSDRAPPPSTPAANILKSPQQVALTPVAPAPPAPAPSAEAATPKKGPPTLAERNQDFGKRLKERGEQEQKAAEEAQRKQSLAEQCASARQYKTHLESGVRISDTGPNGERGYLSDTERAARLAQARKALEGCR
jgi:type IV secretory pathway VirB10-like protein